MCFRLPLVVTIASLALSCAATTDDFRPETIIQRERAALERWGKGDPDGYGEIMAPDITYFDPTTAMRLDGRDKVKGLIEQIRGKLQIDKAEMLNPNVVRLGDMAMLTFNLISRGATFNGSPKTDAHWNSTEIYRRIDGDWKIVHSHWSFTNSGKSVAIPEPER